MSAEAGALWFDDVEIDREVVFGSYHFDRDSIIAYAKKFDPQSFHIDEELAKESSFGALCASGWHSCAGFMKVCAAYNFTTRNISESRGDVLPPLGPSPGFTNMRWPHPVFAGDTITYKSTVTGKREMTSRPDWGLIFTHNQGHNQHGELVMSFDGKLVMARKPK